jgi:helix-turn-helix protein
MPRPERPIDPSQGPISHFAADLRKLREKAGGPSYRKLADSAHYSRATLSDAASGHRLPTLEVTLAYVSACGGDTEQWRERWHLVRSDLGLQVETDHVIQDDPDAETTASDGGRKRWRYRFLFAGGPALVVALALTVLRPADQEVVPGPHPTESMARFADGSEPVADNADPKRAGCSHDKDVSTLDSVEINTRDQHFLGVAELRHSPRCRAAWGRFTPSDRLTYLRGATVSITAYRPATGTTGVPYSTAFDGQAVFGNILVEKSSCLQINVVVQGSAGAGSGRTLCKP